MNKQDLKQALIDMAYTLDAKPRFINEKWTNVTDGRNLKYIEEAVEKIWNGFQPTEMEIAIGIASDLLCPDDDYSIQDQVKAIQDQAKIDGTLMIDDVDGVMVWEAVQLEFTCNAFLKQIGL